MSLVLGPGGPVDGWGCLPSPAQCWLDTHSPSAVGAPGGGRGSLTLLDSVQFLFPGQPFLCNRDVPSVL